MFIMCMCSTRLIVAIVDSLIFILFIDATNEFRLFWLIDEQKKKKNESKRQSPRNCFLFQFENKENKYNERWR